MYKKHNVDLDRSVEAATFLKELKVMDLKSSANLSGLANRAQELIDNAMPCQARKAWEIWLAAARFLQCDLELAAALKTGRGVADARAAKEIRLETLSELLRCDSNGISQTPPGSDKEIAMQLVQTPLPNLYWHVDQSWDKMLERRARMEVEANDPGPLDSLPDVARIAVFIDDCPIVAPQEIAPGRIYKLKIACRFSKLPELVKAIQFEFLSTLAPDQWSIGKCYVELKPDHFEVEKDVVVESTILFPYEQNDPFQKVVVAATAYLVLDETRKAVRVIGHDQLQFRIRSENRTLLSSGFPRMDAHLHDLLQKLISDQPGLKDELKGLLPLLDALVAVQATFAQGAYFKFKSSGTIGEVEFQRETLKCLRMRLGEDVQEGPKQAGGITDIRFRGVIVELKVENKLTDRRVIASKYGQQAAQYAGVEARSISIVLCLDTTEKTRSQGDIRNDVIVEKIKTNEDFPDRSSFVFLFMIRANQQSPSYYSK